MPRRLAYSPAAAADLVDITDWLTQPGSGDRAHRKLDELLDAIEALPLHPQQFPSDLDHPQSRLAIVHGYAIRFHVADGGDVLVERVFGPGQRR